MCLILFGWDCHPLYKLVLASNRDEFYKRPTAPAGVWEDFPDIVAGRDLQKGGTWLGVNRQGSFAAITNYRDPFNHVDNAPSRGILVQNYLTGELSPQHYLEAIEATGLDYNGFNLLLGNYRELFYYSNRERQIREVEPGVHGLSNSLLDVPWPKVSKGTAAFSKALHPADIDVEQLFEIMADQEYPEDQDLPDTGVGLELERMLGPMFVCSEKYNYGTRVTTILLIDRKQRMRFWERSFEPLKVDQWEQASCEILPPEAKLRLSDLPNIGKNMEKRLASIGVEDISALLKMGSKEAFVRLRKQEGDT